jgi:hypothetical protein
MGQIGLSFEINFQEHFLSRKNNNYNSESSQHILGNDHCSGKIEDMEVAFYYKKERHIYTVEKFDIYRETIRGNQTYNMTFGAVQKRELLDRRFPFLNIFSLLCHNRKL